MNTPLRRVGVAMMVMMVILLANATYVQVIKADEYRTSQYNRRGLLEMLSRERGSIIASDGTPLATVTPIPDKDRWQRVYSNGPMYLPVTGYLANNFGSNGLERAENDLLIGEDDRLFTRRLSDLITGRDPKGASLQVTINPKAQQAAYEALGDRTGAVVAIEPKTGKILALVSTPSFDPNKLAVQNIAEEQAYWNEVTQDNAAQPDANRALSWTYPPGSTFKLVVAAAGLEEGMDKSTQVDARPTITLPGTNTELPNFNGNNCNNGVNATLEQAIAESCNTAFAKLASDLGTAKLREQAAKFGIDDQKYQVPMTTAASTIGPIPDQPALYQTGIGQRDVQVTPLANAVMVATIANKGVRMKPYLVDKILGTDTATISETKPDEVDEAMSEDSAQMLTEMMIAAENKAGGTGKLSNIQIASKTGTAEWGAGSTPNPHAWYTAFAPANDPQIALAVIVEKSGGQSGGNATGGRVAAPVGRAVISSYLGSR
ncbi:MULTISPECIES: penicillin-binding protein 2 [Actinosynnema]|uniref:peptidoglycan D,D-transpeptidase FtsI family protein n=1 Tax=Actinosynnema TaxID=40566 RepID=UPI0020A39D25|nr:penicillin-binding transpeptidase domain-containing protein [Actinosynnema pretiosum]MCP2093479.1 cell elongation-specific peptidoglycan D,D-transpeptidase [Actinosynnema pretiosum]